MVECLKIVISQLTAEQKNYHIHLYICMKRVQIVHFANGKLCTLLVYSGGRECYIKVNGTLKYEVKKASQYIEWDHAMKH